jgi:hypothetical protein
MALLSHFPRYATFAAKRLMIREATMLDKPEKTQQLMATLEAAVPFEVALMPDLIEYLARQQKPIAVNQTETVSGVFYLGDMGGISCGIQPADSDSPVIVSLTQVRVPRQLPFAAAVLDYQKHRVKKLKKQCSCCGLATNSVTAIAV